MIIDRAIKNYIKSILPGSRPRARDSGFDSDPETDIVHEDEALRVFYRPGTGSDCIVSFTGVGRSLGGIDLQTPEFSRSGSDAHKLFVIDKNRSWGNRLDWAALERVVTQVAAGRRVVTLGNSMGGFLALLAAGRLGAEQAVAFAPQWSVDPAVMPAETRWPEYRAAIRAFRHPDLSSAFDAPCRFHVFFGDHPLDQLHFERFPKDCAALDAFALQGGGHEIGRFLKDRDLLYPVIDACLAGGSATALLDGAGQGYRRV